jgi:putative heme-binding domain-containing protein
MLCIALWWLQAVATPQIQRGEALFFDANKGCAACHAMKGRGTAVGPDLRNIGRLTPAAIAMAARSTAFQYVQDVTLKGGQVFPAMPGPKDEKVVQLYDLSKTPPELRKLEKDEITSMTATDKWKHPAATEKLTDEQMADIVAYIRWAATGNRNPVDPSDVGK